MEKIISVLQTPEGLEFKLTSEKLFIQSATGMETFALRSINGIGVVDQIELYNSNLSGVKLWKRMCITWGTILVIGGGLISLIGNSVSRVFGVAFILLGIFIYSRISNVKNPELRSSVRIMLNGMNRDFLFIKKNEVSSAVAEFVARVEDTLTAYHKSV